MICNFFNVGIIGEIKKTNERQLQEYKNAKSFENVKKDSSCNSRGGNFLRNSTSRSRSQSLIGSVSTSPTTGSEIGESKKEKDKSHKRKSHLNRAFTDEAVPDNTSSFHLSPHAFVGEGESKSLELSSSEYNSAEPRSRKSSTSIYKVPVIPSILTTNNNESSTTCKTPADNSIKLQLPPSPTMKLKSSSILSKVQTFESRKSSPVVKRDSFSDAEGVSFIKKFLQKESMVEKVPTQLKQPSSPKLSAKEPGFMLKKSPSACSYWSKFSNSQPTFLKKFFEKPEKSRKESNSETEGESVPTNNSASKANNINENEMDTSTPAPTPVVTEEEHSSGFSVAQKASFFMKLEHEQRFSKWRKNSLETSSPTILMSQKNSSSLVPENRSRSSRQLTQPVTNYEVKLASNNISEEKRKLSPCPVYSSPERHQELFGNFNNEMDLENGDEMQVGVDLLSSYEDYEEDRSVEEPSQLSLKDRVHMFDKLIAVGGKAPSATVTPYPEADTTITTTIMSGYPVYHSASENISTSKGSSESPINFYNANQYYSNVKNTSNLESSLFQRRGSTSDIELSSTPKYSPNVSSRNSKTRSMFVADDVSEDGEVSSGGQEVAEIISRSYENSPLVRKKSWKCQKQVQASFTKEIWRRCKVNENWPTAQQHSRKPQQTYKVTTNVTHQTINAQEINPQNELLLQPQTETSSPPATSNLLQILTVLSSSNDELSESKPKKSTRKQLERSLGNSSTDSSLSITDHKNSTGELHRVHVPNPDNESFQKFFGSRNYTSHSSAFSSTNSTAASLNNQFGMCLPNNESQSQPLVDPEMNVVQRESDLLVMKKNVPILRRKSSGKSRNPLKALAARMDFRNQWYTDASEKSNVNNDYS